MLGNPRKTGLSNGIAQQEGYPTSGETSANAGALPAQRAQQPFEHKRAQTNIPQPTARPLAGGGTLNGGAVQGAQYKTAPQPMSPSVAGFVAIPAVTTKFAQPGGPSLPGATPIQMQQQAGPSYFAPGQGQGQGLPQPSSQGQAGVPSSGQALPQPSGQAAGQPSIPQQGMYSATPAAATPPPPQLTPVSQKGFLPSGGVQGGTGSFDLMPQNYGQQQTSTIVGAATGAQPPQPTATGYDYLKELEGMGKYYDVGGEYDTAQRALMDEKMRQQNAMMAAQNQLAGRGGNIAQVSQNYANQLAQMEYQAQRAQLEQQAKQQQFQGQMQYAESVRKAKMDIVGLAKDLDLGLDEEDFNLIAADIVNQYGPNPTAGQMLQVLSGKGDTTTKTEKLTGFANEMRELVNSYALGAESQMVDKITKMDKKTLKNFAATYKSLLQDVLDDTWGDDNEAIMDALNAAGVDTSEFE